ncbi:MAG: ATP-binding protein [Granulosicoccus sp.]
MKELVGSSLLKLTFRQSKRIVIFLGLMILYIGYILSSRTEGSLWFWWTGLTMTIFMLRPFIIQFLSLNVKLTMNVKLIWAGACNAVGGSALGACALFLPELDLADRFVITMLLSGFVAGASVSSAGYSPLFLCTVVPIIVPFSIVMIINPGGYLDSGLSVGIGPCAALLVVCLTIMGRDSFQTFSEHVEMSEHHLHTSRELATALKRAEREQGRAESNNRSKTRFLAAASHDLRQPVHVISLFGAALSTMAKESRVREVVSDMNVAIGLLSTQLDALLDVSKLDSGDVKPDIRELGIRSLVDCAILESKADANSKGLYLVNKVNSTLCVQSDADMLLQILRNLIGNAVKYTDQGGVAVSSLVNDHYVAIVCEDTGVGISAHEQKYIFEEFYQIDNPERDRAKGLGLGLSIVERLVKRLSHDLVIESSVGTGTRIILRLGQVVVSPLGSHGETTASKEATRELRRFDLWIHLVDDEELVLRSMSTLLNELGCKVTTTSTTPETIRFLQYAEPDVAFVDYRLRGSDSGIKTLKAFAMILPAAHRVLITGETLFDCYEVELTRDVRVLRKPLNKERVVETLSAFVLNSVNESRSV